MGKDYPFNMRKWIVCTSAYRCRSTSGETMAKVLSSFAENETDHVLIARWQAGDVEAGDAVVDRFRPMVLHFAARTYHLDPEKCEEVAQETFIRLHKALPTFQRRCAPKTFISSLANHACLDLRRGRRASDERVEAPLEDDAPLFRDEDDPSEGTILNLDLQRCLDKLSERARSLFLAQVYQAASYEQLARQFGMPSGSIGRVLWVKPSYQHSSVGQGS